MDRPFTLRAGILVAALCGALLSVSAFVASGALRQVDELTQRVARAEAGIALALASEADMKARLQRIEDKLDRLVESRNSPR